MTLELLIHFCKLQSHTSHISYTLYNNGKKIYISDYSFNVVDFSSNILSIFQNSKDLINYFIIEKTLIFGYIKSIDGKSILFIGPGRIGMFTDKHFKKVIQMYGIFMQQTENENLSNHLQQLNVMSIETFLNYLCICHCSLNQQIITVQELIAKETEQNLLLNSKQQLTKIKQEKLYSTSSQPSSQIHYEEQISFCIQHGLIDNLTNVLNSTNHEEIGNLGPSALRHAKNATIILNSLSLRSAIAGGVSYDTCYNLGGYYIQKIEDCNDIEQLEMLSSIMLIDYCGRVKNENSLKTTDKTINRCIDYIEHNYQQKLTVPLLAKELGITSEYLSSKFKKVTGINLPIYINQVKVREARNLLAMSNMSIIDISEYLGFTNQSYFQTIFKNISGITPLRYRKENHL